MASSAYSRSQRPLDRSVDPVRQIVPNAREPSMAGGTSRRVRRNAGQASSHEWVCAHWIGVARQVFESVDVDANEAHAVATGLSDFVLNPPPSRRGSADKHDKRRLTAHLLVDPALNLSVPTALHTFPLLSVEEPLALNGADIHYSRNTMAVMPVMKAVEHILRHSLSPLS